MAWSKADDEWLGERYALWLEAIQRSANDEDLQHNLAEEACETERRLNDIVDDILSGPAAKHLSLDTLKKIRNAEHE